MNKEPKTKTITQKLSEIQQKLKVGKSQFNNFGKYSYRSCEDILEAVKPLLGDCALVLTDKIVKVGERYYVKAMADFGDDSGKTICAYAYARESEDKKGMDASQITGSASSYARKYALNGLFCIDDAKDADSMDNTKQVKKPAAQPKTGQYGEPIDDIPVIESEEPTSPFPTTPEGAPRRTDNNPVQLKCVKCGAVITEKVKNYSMKVYGKPYCFDCQKEEGK